MQHLNPYIVQIKTFIVSLITMINQNFNQLLLQIHNYSRFQKFLLLNIILLSVILIRSVVKSIHLKNMWNKIISMVFQLSFVKAKVNADLLRAKKEINDSIPAYGKSKLTKIPLSVPKIQIPDQSDKKIQKGSISGTYYPMKQHSQFVANLAKRYSYSNVLHPDLHPHTQQMQVQVIKMCSKMLNFQDENNRAVGSVLSGGTQSILMAILAYRQYGIKQRGVKRPNLVIAPTGHVAALKAADYLQIQVRTTSLSKDYKMNIRSMKSLIDSNTICVYTSCPNYPYGTVDNIEEIAKYCHKKKVPVHIDMCLGGFLVPFLQKQDGSPFFSVPKGITSISVDPHKYGLSAKGISVLLFSDQQIMKQHYFAIGKWQGGAYGVVGLAGSRCGLPLASAWISMMKNGVQNYTINAKRVQGAVLKLRSTLVKLGYQIMGDPQICTIGFTHPRIPLGNITEQMKKRGWGLSLLQKPIAIHYSFTPINSMNIDKMVKDFEQITTLLQKKIPQCHEKNSMLELYGVCAHIPDGPTKGLILNTILDAFSDA